MTLILNSFFFFLTSSDLMVLLKVIKTLNAENVQHRKHCWCFYLFSLLWRCRCRSLTSVNEATVLRAPIGSLQNELYWPQSGEWHCGCTQWAETTQSRSTLCTLMTNATHWGEAELLTFLIFTQFSTNMMSLIILCLLLWIIESLIKVLINSTSFRKSNF